MKRLLDDWVDAYLEYTAETEPATLFRCWTAISVIAAALQRKCYLQWGTETWYPNMYIVLCGPSGSRKGTAMKPGRALLDEIGIKMAAESVTRERLIQDLCNASGVKHDPNTGEICVHSSLTIFSQELTVFLGYKNVILMADLCDWYDCRERWNYSTKHQGEEDIIGVWVNLIGATTPHLIRNTMSLDAIGGGLTSRIIFVYEERKGRICPTPFLSARCIELKQKLKLDLERIHLMSGSFSFTEEFLELWTQWYTSTETNKPFDNELFAGYMERRPTHIMKLSQILSAARSDEMIITADDLRKAITLLEATEIKMPRVFSGVGSSSIAELVPRAMAFIGNKRRVTRQEFSRFFMQDADHKQLDLLIRSLKEMGYIEIVVNEQGKESLVYKEG